MTCTHTTPIKLRHAWIGRACRPVVENKVNVETVAAAFTDYLAVGLRVSLDVPRVQRGRDLWLLNKRLVDDINIRLLFQREYTRWRSQLHNFPHILIWWNRFVKCNIRLFFMKEGKERD